ncbi:MAG: hypothetical protein COB08_000175 [Rhodobacteraceae bacterium]|nr:hypothetical protein [Paracoccaceae bacterium]
MKICVIGNSHVAAIKLAYEALGPNPPHKMTFFAGLGRRIASFEASNGLLIPPADDHKIKFAISITSGGLTEINPALYDRILVIGMCGALHKMVSTVSRPLSEGAKACAITDYWQAAHLPALLQNLRKITQKPICVGAPPLLAEARQHDTSTGAYSSLISLSNSLFFKDFTAQFIGQPLDTIVNGNATEISFSRMSERLIEGKGDFAVHHPEGENSHMNQSYGALWLKQYYEIIAAETKR